MKVAITGGAGFIGQHLTTALLAERHQVTWLDILTPQIHGAVPVVHVPQGVTLVREDVRALAEQPHLIDGHDIVFHLAAETGTAQSMYQMRRYADVNLMGTAILLEALARCEKRPQKVLLASSRSVYGEGAYQRLSGGSLIVPKPRTGEDMRAGRFDIVSPVDEDIRPVATPETLLPCPGSLYAATKLAQESLLDTGAAGLGITTTHLRLQNVFGEGQSLQNPYTGIISIFFNRARQGLELNIYEDGEESRDFVHISDVVQAFLLAMSGNTAHGSVYNVGSGRQTSIMTLARTLLAVSGCDVPVRISGQFRVGDIRHCFADITRISADLGFAPKVSLQEGLTRFYDWARTQQVFTDRSAAAAQELRERGLAN